MAASKTLSQTPVQKLAELIRNIRIAMLTTVEDDGELRSRPMATQMKDFDGTLWFLTRDGFGKVDEVRRDHHVNLSYSDTSDHRYVSVSGVAKAYRDQGKIDELWNPLMKAWFPNGPTDPRITLLEVAVHRAEFWDAPAGKMTSLIGFVKTMLTGKPADDLGGNRKIDLAG